MTYQDLLNRVDDLLLLAVPPVPGEASGCMSSYDRRSRYDPDTDTYEDWDANDDGTGYIRRLDDGTIVAFEADGPGVIWRIWSALPQSGHIRIYLDDKDTPAIDVPFIDWFERSAGEVPPLNLSELSARLSRGRNSFIPIPFSHYCRVELAPDWGCYYHFTYTRFPSGTVMPNYQERFSPQGCIALAKLDRRLYDRGDPIPDTILAEAVIPAGTTQTMWACDGAGALSYIMFNPASLSDPSEEVLRRIVLEICWDGSDHPAVLAPVGDFFGSAPGINRFHALPLSMNRYAFESRWFMPFSQGARIRIRNLSDSEQRISLRLAIEPCENADQLLRFHARWHQGVFIDTDAARFAPGHDRWPDWPILLTKGRGRFCGLHLHVYNKWTEPEKPASTWWYGQWESKSVDWWWGEGDEKLFVDGEKSPSTFGTGSEDYVGYAWAAEPPFARFEHPFACLSRMPIDGNGHTSVSRFQIADNVPFQHSFEGYLEKYKSDIWSDHGSHGKCLYAATPYWYQDANSNDAYPDISPESLWGQYHL